MKRSLSFLSIPRRTWTYFALSRLASTFAPPLANRSDLCAVPSSRRTSLVLRHASSATPTPASATMTSPKIQVLSSNVEKPEIDDRSYRLIRLGDNKLEALLVHDPKTD